MVAPPQLEHYSLGWSPRWSLKRWLTGLYDIDLRRSAFELFEAGTDNRKRGYGKNPELKNDLATPLY
jgi:hypothetical protein